MACAQGERAGELRHGIGLQGHEHRADLVLAHLQYGLLTQYLRVTEVSAVEQHAHEHAVVARGRIQSAIATVGRRWSRRNRGVLARHEPTARVAQRRDEARLLVLRHGEGGIRHSEGTEDMLLIPALQVLAGDSLDDEAENPGARAIVPLLAGLAQQRQLPLRLLIALLQPGHDGIREAVAEPGGVGEQVADRHDALRRTGVVGAVLGVEPGDDLQLVEPGQVLRHRVVDRQLAALGQHHDGDRRDGLGHGGDIENRVRRQSAGLGVVELAGRCLEQHSLAIDHQADDRWRITALYGLRQHLRQRARGGCAVGRVGEGRAACETDRPEDEQGRHAGRSMKCSSTVHWRAPGILLGFQDCTRRPAHSPPEVE